MFREKMAGFMAGRNGMDALGKCTTWISLLLLVITMFSHSTIIYLLALLLLIYSYFRMMSRNISKRYLENQRYLQVTDRIRPAVKRMKENRHHFVTKIRLYFYDRKTYHIYRCPSCRQKVRVPRKKGKIEITCPKCRNTFIRKS